MRNYNSILNQSQTQQQPILGRNDMVQNNAGGYVFKINPQQQLERFLLCGTENGSYYASESKLTLDNAKSIVEYIKQDGMQVLNVLKTMKNRVPKKDTVLFVLALTCTHGNQAVKEHAYDQISDLCQTATHLFTFVSQVNEMRGWSRGLRSAVAQWYTSKNDDKLSYQLIKYRNRAGFTHKDVLRLAHPKALTDSQNTLFKYVVDKISGLEVDNVLINAFTLAMTSADPKEIVRLIESANLTWEMIPTQFLNDKNVLLSLIPNMPTQALIRNLGRISKAGLTTGNNDTVRLIKQKLSPESIEKSGIHPINLVNSMLTYSKGRGDKGDSTWPVNQGIVDVLNEGYYAAVKSIVPTNKNILIGLDVSGSMNAAVGGTQLMASNLGALIAVTTLNSEPNTEVVAFDTVLKQFPFGKRTPVDQVLNSRFSGGGTDCSLPFQYALHTKQKYDAIIILTDSETWAGKQHSLTFLNEYKKINKDVKVIEVAMVANPYSTLPEDANLLRIVGFDSAVPQLINEFIK